MRTVPLALLVLLLAFTTAGADDPPAKASSKDGNPPSVQELRRLVAQLGDESADRRVAARKRLEAIGQPAVEILTWAVDTHGDSDVRAAAKSILAVIEVNTSGLLIVIRATAEQGPSGRINGVAISPDGTRAVSVGWDNVARYWSLANGDLLRELRGHQAPVMGVAFSPDGKRILTGSSDRTLRLWDPATGQVVRTFEGHPDRAWDVAFSPDGTKVLSGCSDGIARLWDVASGAKLLDLEAQKGGRAWTVAFTPDGRRAVTGGGNALEQPDRPEASLKLWDLVTGKEVRRFEGHSKDIRRVAVSPDGKYLLSGSFDGTMRLWELETGREARRFDGPGHFVESVAFTPDGKQAVCSYGPRNADAIHAEDPSCSLRLWDVATGRELRLFQGHTGPVLSLALSRDGRLLMSSSADGTLRLWQLRK
jgi:WD40 repeat protein